MQHRMRLNEAYKEWLASGGIFKDLNEFNVPWKGEVSPVPLDIAYHGGHSGSKKVSTLVDNFIAAGELTPASRALIAGAVYNIYAISWAKEYATLSAEYNPIENYNMREVMTDDITEHAYGGTRTRTDNLQHTRTGTDTETLNLSDARTLNTQHAKTGTETETLNLTDERTLDTEHAKTGTDTETFNLSDARTLNTQHAKTGTERQLDDERVVESPAVTTQQNRGIYGFNSASASPSDTQTETASGTNTTDTDRDNTKTYNITEADTGTDTLVKTGTDATQYNTTEADTGTDTLVKTGTDATQYNTTEADTGTDTLVKTGTDSTQYNTMEADTGTQTDAHTGTDTDTRNYELTRSGNIGVTTSQQMLQSERDLWLWNFFRDVVFADIDKLLTLSVY